MSKGLNRKSFHSILLVILTILLTLIPLTASAATDTWNGSLASGFAGGGGSSGSPYLISTGAQLAYLAQQVNGGVNYSGNCFKLTDDINLNNIEWTPIGTGNSFNGTFDGDGKIISNLKIGSSGSRNTTFEFAGLFGFISGGTVKNVGVVNTAIYSSRSNTYVGGLVGGCLSSTMENCYATGTVMAGEVGYVGGLVGDFISSAIKNSYATCNVTGGNNNEKTGGLIGEVDSSTVENSYATGNVTGGSDGYSGGLAGIVVSIQGTNSNVTNCYATGIVTGGSGTYAGGLFGAFVSSTATYCYWNTTAITTGIAYGTADSSVLSKSSTDMMNSDFVTLLNNHRGSNVEWRLDTESKNNGYPILNGIGAGVVTATAPTVSTQPVSNINTTTATGNGNITSLGSPNPTAYGVCWNTTGTPNNSDSKVDKGAASATGAFTCSMTGLTANNTYYVRAFATNTAGTTYGDQVSFTTFAAGSGTEADPYLVSTEQQLNNVRNNLTAYYKQTADIVLTGAWTPIGDLTTSFTGSYDGNRYMVNGLSITGATTNDNGLFGVIGSGGTVKNLGVSGNISAAGADGSSIAARIGLLAGWCNGGTVQNCYSTGSVTTATNVAGGLLGSLGSTGKVSKCYSNAAVTATGSASSNIAGFIGNTTATTPTIDQCYCTGNVTNNNTTGSNNTAGFIGLLTGSISNCYATGNVSSTSGGRAGGFVGGTGTLDTTSFSNCYSTGSITCPTVGGFVGYYNKGSFTNCFFDSTTFGSTNACGTYVTSAPTGITAKTTTELKTQSTFTNWDFVGETTNGTNDYWGIDATKNNGYPYMAWQYPAQNNISSVIRGGSAITNAASVSWTVTFAASVTGLTSSNFTLTNTGLISPEITDVIGAGTTWTVTASTGTGSGTLGLNLTNSTNLSSSISNTLPFVGEVYTIDKTAPTISGVSDSQQYNTSVSPTFEEGNATLKKDSNDAVSYTSGTEITEAGTYILTVTDTAGNSTVVNFTIKTDECFIATAAYGSKFQPAVVLLRHFRDDYLSKTQAGRAFINFYYRNSPPIAAQIAGNGFLIAGTRLALAPIVAVVYMIYNPQIAILLGLCLILGTAGMALKRSNHNQA